MLLAAELKMRFRENGLIVVGCEWSLPFFLAIMRIPYAIFGVLLLNFCLRFPYLVVCFLLHTFVVRYLLMMFHACMADMKCACEMLCFLLHNFRTRYLDEMSCFLGPLRAFLTIVRILDEMSCFLASNLCFDGAMCGRWRGGC
jgi:hypothetical protein